ncbi:SGNH/GDSL hydrolase family protein [Xanthocytophaga agilis]|uniref:SGNH/GDSL hydrolase family protein n=1 Tax=Xanthocytophaga agilis TaxID=3048010 RepID=A0AAE3QWN2_9BACT|nr:SGNH/GDSL hydrolase family protein [Xanthocytophaga agilis]MDJ1499421.1 SGNH/GDSL hydrolase family protein [Xanthocytophaga agilis]
MKKLFLLISLFLLYTSFKPKELTWVAIGDSITYLNDHPDETGNRITKGYLTGVTEKLPHIHVINQGHNGWTSGGIAESLDKLGLVKADIYSIFLGTNDWWRGRLLGKLSDYQNNTGNGTVYGSFRLITNKLRELNPQAKIILITPMQRGDFVYINNPKNNAYGSYKPKNEQMLEQFVWAIDSIAKVEKFAVVDLYHQKELDLKHIVQFKRLKDPTTGEYKNYPYPEYIGIPYNPETDEYPYPVQSIDMTYDGLHPSDKGYEVITRMLVAIMKKY